MTTTTGRPTWLLDIDGVLNADSDRPPRHIWDRTDWHNVVVHADDGPYRILYAQPVVDFINVVAESGRVDIVWHTSWRHEADKFATRVGLPAGLPVLDCPEYDLWDRDRAAAWWKTPAVLRWAATHPETPLLWTDDEIGRLSDADLGILGAGREFLVLCPAARYGLTPMNLRTIHRFIDQFRPHPTITTDPALWAATRAEAA